jgi:serine/threonine-protein kinase
MALVTGAPRSADVVVAEDAVLWALDRAHFLSLVETSVPLLRALNEYLCQRVALLTLELEDLRAGVRGSEAPGELRFGLYRALEQIGAGGMAVVYSAVHEVTAEAAAVKVLPSVWGNAPELRQRLAREADVLQRLQHPNVVHVHQVGAVAAAAGGGCYVAMEWLPSALDRILRAGYPRPLVPERALAIARGVAQALAAVDALGVVHRDVKPGNIMLRADGTPVLTDFGLAKVRSEAATVQGLTATNMVVGTADYMSPEQVAGRELDVRSDLYALGVVLYEMLAGHVPFAGREPLEMLRAHVDEAPPPLPADVPAPAREIVARALQKRPADRFQDAEQMVAAISAAQEQHPLPA